MLSYRAEASVLSLSKRVVLAFSRKEEAVFVGSNGLGGIQGSSIF
jgi:hypothetical protein